MLTLFCLSPRNHRPRDLPIHSKKGLDLSTEQNQTTIDSNTSSITNSSNDNSECSTKSVAALSSLSHRVETGSKDSIGPAEGNAVPKYLSSFYAKQSILSGDIRPFVKLPKYIQRSEWISSHSNLRFLHTTCYAILY